MKYPLPISPVVVLFTLTLLSAPPCAAKDAAPPPLPPPVMQKPEARGTYQDSKGGMHPWSIGQAHILTWDKVPYLPVGASFTPQSWIGTGSEDDWAKDALALGVLSKRGVREVTLSAGTKGLTHIPVASVQRVLDYLDANNFRYGLEIADFPKDPLVGYIIKPSVYRNAAVSDSGPTEFRHIPNLAGGFYVLVSPHDGEVEETGRAQLMDSETALVAPKATTSGDVLLLYPERLYLSGTPESHLPDLWQGYDEYRDRVLAFFSRVKLGPGFRFFLDPLTEQVGFGGEVDNVIPTTDGYRLDFEAWLNQKYNHNVDDLNRGWGIMDKNLPDFTVAARCVPLWSGAKGVPAVYDPVKKVTYMVLNKPRIGGHLWDDIRAFRMESVRGYMNAMADVLKKGVANVPVVYQWSGRSALLTNSDTRGGFDGISMPATASGAYAFAQAEDNPRTTWLIGTDSGAVDAASKDWDALKTLGARGFFAPAETTEAARRLGEYGSALSFEAADLNTRPLTLAYPAGVNDLQAETRQLSNGVWWLPSYRVGAIFGAGGAFTLGPMLRGYRLVDPDGGPTRFVIWSPRGAMTQARLPFAKTAKPFVTDARGVPLIVEHKKGTFYVPVGADPIVISNVASIPLPLDAAEAAEKEALRLLKLAKEQGLSIDLMQERLFYAQKILEDTPENSDLRYNTLARAIGEISYALQPFVWIEGENASTHTFDSIASDSESSGGSYLSLDTIRQPPSSGTDTKSSYHADYKFSVNTANPFAVWIASSPTLSSSPFTWRIDNGGENEVQDVETEGGVYAGKFIWSHLGDATLTRGPHTLTITVTGPRPRDNRYVLSVDALCLSRVPFHPDGATPPAIEFLPPPPEDKNKKDKKKS